MYPSLVRRLVSHSWFTGYKILKRSFQNKKFIFFRKILSQAPITEQFHKDTWKQLFRISIWSWPIKVETFTQRTISRPRGPDLVVLRTDSSPLTRLWSTCHGWGKVGFSTILGTSQEGDSPTGHIRTILTILHKIRCFKHTTSSHN